MLLFPLCCSVRIICSEICYEMKHFILYHHSLVYYFVFTVRIPTTVQRNPFFISWNLTFDLSCMDNLCPRPNRHVAGIVSRSTSHVARRGCHTSNVRSSRPFSLSGAHGREKSPLLTSLSGPSAHYNFLYIENRSRFGTQNITIQIVNLIFMLSRTLISTHQRNESDHVFRTLISNQLMLANWRRK